MENMTSTISFALSPPRVEEQIRRLRYVANSLNVEPICILMGTATYAKFHVEMRDVCPFPCVGEISKYEGLKIHVLPLAWYLELGYSKYRFALCVQLEREQS